MEQKNLTDLSLDQLTGYTAVRDAENERLRLDEREHGPVSRYDDGRDELAVPAKWRVTRDPNARRGRHEMRIGRFRGLPWLVAWAAAALMLAGWATGAQATLVGDVVGCAQIGGGSFACNQANAVVADPGGEFVVGISGRGLLVDLDASSITLTPTEPFFTFVTIIALTSLDWVGMPAAFIADAVLSSVSGVSGVAQSDIAFGPHAVTLDLRNTDWDAGGSVVIDLVTAVPGAATLVSLGIGLAALGALRRRILWRWGSSDGGWPRRSR